MSLLLDAQALPWFLLDDTRLTESARNRISVSNSDAFVGPASLWEIAIKISLGKYALPMPFENFWEERLRKNDFDLLDLSVSHAAKLFDLPFHHRVSFRRLIVSRALVEGFPVVGSDKAFDACGVQRIWKQGPPHHFPP
ncbi:MAG: type II toxin-antitoxin system VapC family toxin [Desulfococcaceae bacterium]